jgi:hypothetical protein
VVKLKKNFKTAIRHHLEFSHKFNIIKIFTELLRTLYIKSKKKKSTMPVIILHTCGMVFIAHIYRLGNENIIRNDEL